MKKKRSTLLVALLVLSMLLSMVGGSAMASDTPSDISWMTMLHTDMPASEEMVQAINELANVNLTFNWVINASRDEKLNTALASGRLADIVQLPDIEATTIRAALESGMFWDVEPYIADYPNLMPTAGQMDSVRVNGVLYGVPGIKPVARYGVIIRQDWLDKLGLAVPTNFEELMAVAIAFTNEDPDGNGVADTYGIVDRSESFRLSFRMVAGWYGAPCNWGVTADGKVEPWFMHEGYFTAMEKYRELNEAGAINSDFAVMQKTDQGQAIAQSKGGIVITGLMDTKNYVQTATEIGMADQMVWTQINNMHAEGVERRILSDTGNGVDGLYAFPKQYVETEEELRTCLAFLNTVASDEGFLLFTNGVEGKHYEVIDGVITIKDEPIWRQEVQALSSSRINELLTYKYKTANEIGNMSNALIVENQDYAVYDAAKGLTSPTAAELWTQLYEHPRDAYYQYVMGQIDMDAVHAANEKWLAQGGQAMIDEYSASYQSAYGK